MKRVVDKLKELGKTISTMESCTGGGLANAITNIEGASEVIQFSAVTYSNEYKIKMGVSEGVINTYSVYSMETAMEMSKNISIYTNSDYGVGITGKLDRIDKNNLFGDDKTVFVCIYDRALDSFNKYCIQVYEDSREKNKQLVIELIADNLMSILSNNKVKRLSKPQ